MAAVQQVPQKGSRREGDKERDVAIYLVTYYVFVM